MVPLSLSLGTPCCSSTAIYIAVFFFNDTATTEIYTLSLHDALPISPSSSSASPPTLTGRVAKVSTPPSRSEEHTSELQSPDHLVSRLLLEKKISCIDNCTHVTESFIYFYSLFILTLWLLITIIVTHVFFFLLKRKPQSSTPFPNGTLFR